MVADRWLRAPHTLQAITVALKVAFLSLIGGVRLLPERAPRALALIGVARGSPRHARFMHGAEHVTVTTRLGATRR